MITHDDNSLTPLLDLKRISFSYDAKIVLNNVDFCLNDNERIGVVGATGCGKSTFLLLIMGLIKPDKGVISIFGNKMNTEKEFSQIRTRIGFLFQNADDQLFLPTVIEDIAFGPLNQGKSVEEAEAISIKLLEKLNIMYLKGRVTHKLSGGEKKLVALATILAMEPEFLLLDEPVTGLDPLTKNKITDLLKNMEIPMVVISHDWEFLDQVTGSTLVFENGLLQEKII